MLLNKNVFFKFRLKYKRESISLRCWGRLLSDFALCPTLKGKLSDGIGAQCLGRECDHIRGLLKNFVKKIFACYRNPHACCREDSNNITNYPGNDTRRYIINIPIHFLHCVAAIYFWLPIVPLHIGWVGEPQASHTWLLFGCLRFALNGALLGVVPWLIFIIRGLSKVPSGRPLLGTSDWGSGLSLPNVQGLVVLQPHGKELQFESEFRWWIYTFYERKRTKRCPTSWTMLGWLSWGNRCSHSSEVQSILGQNIEQRHKHKDKRWNISTI